MNPVARMILEASAGAHGAVAQAIAAAWTEKAAETTSLRELAATCYAGLGAECDLPETWLDALLAAAQGQPFSTDGLLPYTTSAAPKVDEIMTEVQEFASAWSSVGGPFDDGTMLEEAEAAKRRVRERLVALARTKP